MDSVIILNEVVEEMKKKNEDCVIFKIDFAKAYDSVEWCFLKRIMVGFGFDSNWIHWIMECISMAKVSIDLINGCPMTMFQLEKGVPQGDPLSPFLFLLAAEGMSLMMCKAVAEGLFQPILVGKDRISLSHIQFADDLLLMGKA